LLELLALPNETEWTEFKENVSDPDLIGKRVAALANSAALIGLTPHYLLQEQRMSTLSLIEREDHGSATPTQLSPAACC
jgi:hypothetical protein